MSEQAATEFNAKMRNQLKVGMAIRIRDKDDVRNGEKGVIAEVEGKYAWVDFGPVFCRYPLDRLIAQ